MAMADKKLVNIPYKVIRQTFLMKNMIKE
jgi:hypothetical protein